jgi:hypothetical protein
VPHEIESEREFTFRGHSVVVYVIDLAERILVDVLFEKLDIGDIGSCIMDGCKSS